MSGLTQTTIDTPASAFMGKAGVYQIQNLNNGKRYVGSSVDVYLRLRKHREMLERGSHYNVHLQRSWKKNGEREFSFQILVFCDKKMLTFYEQRVMNTWSPEFNINPNAANRLGTVHTYKTRSKMSKTRIGKPIPALRGRKLSPEHRAKVVTTLDLHRGNRRGVRLSEDHKRKISASLVGNKRALGKRWTVENRRRGIHRVRNISVQDPTV